MPAATDPVIVGLAKNSDVASQPILEPTPDVPEPAIVIYVRRASSSLGSLKKRLPLGHFIPSSFSQANPGALKPLLSFDPRSQPCFRTRETSGALQPAVQVGR
jgi:hypothetical protein